MCMNVSRFLRLTYAAHADTYDCALVRCNSTAGVLVVREDFTEDDVNSYKAPAAYQSKWLGALVEYLSPPKGVPNDATRGTYRHKIGDWRLSCALKGVVYQIVVSPWSEDDMVMGQCGAGDPDLELTVFRDKHLLVRNLRLGGGCLHGNAIFLDVKLSETQNDVTLGDIRVPYSEKVTVPDIHIPYSRMPLFDQSRSTIVSGKPT